MGNIGKQIGKQLMPLKSEPACPKCGCALEYDEVDIGVGVQRGNYGCPNCHWMPPGVDAVTDIITRVNPTPRPVFTDDVMHDVDAAMIHAVGKHGPLTNDLVRASGILCSEAAEVMDEALKLTNPNGTGSHRNAKGTHADMYHEAAQVAATAMLIMENLATLLAKR